MNIEAGDIIIGSYKVGTFKSMREVFFYSGGKKAYIKHTLV